MVHLVSIYELRDLSDPQNAATRLANINVAGRVERLR